MKLPRLAGTIAVTVALFVAILLLAPQQLPVTLYKLSLLSTAGVAGYWLDRALFPYARPDSYLVNPDRIAGGLYVGVENPIEAGYRLAFNAAMIRRAIIVGCAMLAIGLGA